MVGGRSWRRQARPSGPGGDGTLRRVIRLEAATVLLQWAVGGMAFCWFTTRRREVGLGYGWLLRGVYAAIAFGAFAAGLLTDPNPVREASAAATGITCLAVLAVSVARRSAGVRGQREEHDRRTARVAAMTGIDRSSPAPPPAGVDHRKTVAEFDPRLDLLPVAVGTIGLLAAAIDVDGEVALSVLRTLVGAAFLGAITDAMLLGHWYLVQPGLPRRRLNELVDAVAVIWPIEVLALLIPTGMLSVWSGSIDDGWGGMLGWMWAACAVTTIVLVFVTKAALRERQYSAVMAATGLLYLAILTAFGTDIVARAVLSP
jgi:hypothetical protein